jgi:hypothetical protein
MFYNISQPNTTLDSINIIPPYTFSISGLILLFIIIIIVILLFVISAKKMIK